MPVICIHYDSKFAIERAQSNMYIDKSWHACCKHNTIRQLLSIEVISTDNVMLRDNKIDPLTKRLSRGLVEKSSREKGLKTIKEKVYFMKENPT